MTISRALNSALIWIVCVCYLIPLHASLSAQNNTDPKSGYIRKSTNGSTIINIIDRQSNYSFEVSAENCFNISRDLERVAVSQRENPSTLDFYDLRTGMLVVSVSIPSNWTNSCAFGWIDNQQVRYRPVANDPTRFLIDSQTGTVTETNASSSPIILPNHPPEDCSAILLSGNLEEVLYLYCPSGTYSLGQSNCAKSPQMAIYRWNENTVTHVIDIAPVASVAVARQFNPEIFMSWSPVGNYVLYETGAGTIDFVVYDKENETPTTNPSGQKPYAVCAMPSAS